MITKLQLLLFFSFPFFLSAQQRQETHSDALKNELIEEGIRAFFKKDIITLKKINRSIDSLCIKTQDSMLLAKYYHLKALKNKLTYTNDSAYYYYHLSKNISKRIKDSLAAGRRLLSIAMLQREAKDFLGSEISSIEALQFLEPIKSDIYLERVYNNLGLISDELNQEDEALIYYNKALFYNEIVNNNTGYLYLVNNLGLLYQRKNENKKAIEYFKKGLAYNNIKKSRPEEYVLLLENLAASNFLLGNKKNVLKQYNEVLKIRDSLKDLKGVSTTHLNIASFYEVNKDFKKTKYHANEALVYAKQTHNNKRWLQALKLLSEVTKGRESVSYLEKYIQLNDSLLQKERTLKNQFAKVRYETNKKEKENAVLKTENEKIEAEVVYHKQQETIGWLLFAVSFFGLGFSILFFITRRRKLIYEYKLQKVQAREKERQLIAKSLHDEVAGDLRVLHQRLQKSQLFEEATKLNNVKENVRNLSHKLSSISFEKVSFKDQIVNLVADYFEPDFKIKISGLYEDDWQSIDENIKRVLYLSIRECIQNCQKYAQATKVDLDFSIHKKNVFLSIADNGIGFDSKTNKKGIGLQNLEERLEELNGSLSIDSKLNTGTEIHIQLPLNVY